MSYTAYVVAVELIGQNPLMRINVDHCLVTRHYSIEIANARTVYF